MKRYLVIGNPIEHSFSPKIHNYWIKNNSINAIYEKQKLNEDEIESLILKVKKKELNGVNVTVGLPVIRTSVDHGTAFDIAGKGIADERNIIEALKKASEYIY